jgi:putative flippase GtrA
MIRKLNDLFASKEFLNFLFVGGFAALINVISRIFYNYYMGFSEAIILAYLTGMITAFLLSKFYVFDKSKHSTLHEITYFTLVNIAAVIQTWIVSMLLYHYLLKWMDISLYKKEIAHMVGVAVPVFSSYMGHKYLTFRK